MPAAISEVATVPPFEIESLGAGEQRASFRVNDSWCRVHTLELRSGVRLGVTACQFEPSFSFLAVQPPSELEFVVSKGSFLHTRTSDGDELYRGGTALQVGRTKNPLPLVVRSTGEVPTECVSLSMNEAYLRELLGGAELPKPLHHVMESSSPHPLVSQAMPPKLFRLLDEILNADATGAARRLWHEAKSLELLALITDELIAEASAQASHLSTSDVDRLGLVRHWLSEHFATTPTLSELARKVGMSETRLKAGFRALFGQSVFSCLREIRMNEARRLLAKRHLSVTEIAQRVGYANPSKIAAAYRRQYGMSPSTR